MPIDRAELTVQRLLRILDLSRDLERNRDDNAFGRLGGRITYVFDENIFEMFVRPWKHASHVETFHGDLWIPLAGGNTKHWRSIEAQSALVTAEYLLEADLPGATSDRIYLTDPHRWEFASRVEALSEDLQQEIADNPSLTSSLRGKLEMFLEFVEAAEAPGSTPTRRHRLQLKTAELWEDIDALRGSEVSPAVIERFGATRVAAEILALDTVLEPLEQIHRLGSDQIRRRLCPIAELYAPTPRELRAIEADADQWHQRLLNELVRPGRRSTDRNDRALYNDALSVAFMQWAARKATHKNERLVMITGDPVVFDAYRRWYSGPANTRPDLEPFVLRRVTQYAPIFNFVDAKTDLSTAINAGAPRTLSSLLMESLEATLVALSLPNILDSTDDVMVARTRERLTLKLVDRVKLADDEDLGRLVANITPKWLEDHTGKIRAVRRHWQAAQRAAIGSAYRLVSKRLNADELRLARTLAESGAAEAGPALQTYITELLDAVVSDCLDIWLPLAAETIQNRRPVGSGRRPRAPFTVDLPLPRGHTLAGLARRWWDRPQDTGELRALLSPSETPEIANRPDLVFAIAAALAYLCQEANDAERFAGLAVRAQARGSAEQAPRTRLELSFLHALTIRFQMASVGVRSLEDRGPNPTAAQDASRLLYLIKKTHSRAERALGRHRQELEALRESKALSEDTNLLLDIRALSEQAALDLFLGVALNDAARRGAADGSTTEARQHVGQALESLRQCFVLQRRVKNSNLDLLGRLELQFVPNLAACEVIRYLVAEPGGYSFDDRVRAYVKPVLALARTLVDPHPLLEVELLAFQILAGREPANAKSRFAALRRRRDALRLPLDLSLFNAILAEFA